MLRNSWNTHLYHNYVELSNEADLFTKSKSEEKLDRKISLFSSTEFFLSEITGGEVRDKHLREDLFTSSSRYISLKNRFLFSLMRYIYMLFAGWEVRTASGSIFKTSVTVYHNTDRPLAGK